MAITDIVTLILSLLFLLRGASRGFISSLISPFSFIVTTVISIIYYQNTKDIIISLIIGLLGPFVLYLLINRYKKTMFPLKPLANTSDTSMGPNFLSRLGGMIVTLVWGWVFIVLALIFLAVLPPWGDVPMAIHRDVMNSNSYLIAKPLENILLGGRKENIPAAAGAPSSADAKSLAQDPRFQKILQDPEIKQEIEAHDIVKLMGNPKMMDFVQQIMSDPATMKKILGIYKSQSQPILIPDTHHSSQAGN